MLAFRKKKKHNTLFICLYKRCHKSTVIWKHVVGTVTCPSLQSQHSSNIKRTSRSQKIIACMVTYSRVRNLHSKNRTNSPIDNTKTDIPITSLGPLQRTFQNKLPQDENWQSPTLPDESNGQDERPPNGTPSHATWRSWRDVALISPHFAHWPDRAAYVRTPTFPAPVVGSCGPGTHGVGPVGDQSDSAIRIGILVHVVGVFCAPRQSALRTGIYSLGIDEQQSGILHSSISIRRNSGWACAKWTLGQDIFHPFRIVGRLTYFSINLIKTK